MAKDVAWEDAIQAVLRTADGALHYSEIAEQIVAQGLRKAVGATPARTVSTYLSISLKELDSPYLRVGRGEYTLKEITHVEASVSVRDTVMADESAETGAMRSFGMFWQRDLVVWSGKPRLLGRQGLGALEVNFADQIGVYLLHDRDRVIYVGRATDTLFTRLRAHTTDRLGGRWDRFSWFGLREVGADGMLTTNPVPWSQAVVIETMEAVLIESMEPPLNRKRGDNFSGAEYLQASDPEVESARKRALLGEMMKAANLS